MNSIIVHLVTFTTTDARRKIARRLGKSSEDNESVHSPWMVAIIKSLHSLRLFSFSISVLTKDRRKALESADEEV